MLYPIDTNSVPTRRLKHTAKKYMKPRKTVSVTSSVYLKVCSTYKSCIKYRVIILNQDFYLKTLLTQIIISHQLW
jgi:hypothetical protein